MFHGVNPKHSLNKCALRTCGGLWDSKIDYVLMDCLKFTNTRSRLFDLHSITHTFAFSPCSNTQYGELSPLSYGRCFSRYHL